MAKVQTTNQTFPIPEDWVALADDSQEAKLQRDTRVRRLLSSYLPAITNAQLSYSTEGEETIVRVTPQLGTKGREEVPAPFSCGGLHCDLAGVHVVLRDAPAYRPPALLLAWELKWTMLTGQLTFERLLAFQPRIQAVLQDAAERGLVEHLHERLRDLPALPCPLAPPGF